jgi:hypothetical protein
MRVLEIPCRVGGCQSAQCNGQSDAFRVQPNASNIFVASNQNQSSEPTALETITTKLPLSAPYAPNNSRNGSILPRRRYVALRSTPKHVTDHSVELINIHSAFHSGAFQQVLDFDTSSFSSSNALPVRVLQLRSKIALGQAKVVSSELASEKTPDLIAVKLLADQEQGKDVLSQARKLADQYGQENLSIQLLVGIILEKAGETEDALALLSKHQGSLDAYVIAGRSKTAKLTCPTA